MEWMVSALMLTGNSLPLKSLETMLWTMYQPMEPFRVEAPMTAMDRGLKT
jgi:hypothetical protein